MPSGRSPRTASQARRDIGAMSDLGPQWLHTEHNVASGVLVQQKASVIVRQSAWGVWSLISSNSNRISAARWPGKRGAGS
jgi:hypothetical protein